MLKLGWGQRAPSRHQLGHMGRKEVCGFIVILYVLISSAWCALHHLDPRLTEGHTGRLHSIAGDAPSHSPGSPQQREPWHMAGMAVPSASTQCGGRPPPSDFRGHVFQVGSSPRNVHVL